MTAPSPISKTAASLVGLTRKQRSLYDFIYARIVSTGVAPTIRLIAKEFGHKSTSSAHRMVESLIHQGMISRKGGSLTLTSDMTAVQYQSVPTMLLSPMVCNHFDEFIGMEKGTMRQIVQDAMLYRNMKIRVIDPTNEIELEGSG